MYHINCHVLSISFRLVFSQPRVNLDPPKKPALCHVMGTPPPQALLGAVLRARRPAALASLPGVQPLADGLHVYSLRHYSRVDRLLRSTALLDYTLAAMKVRVFSQLPSDFWCFGVLSSCLFVMRSARS